MGLVHKVFQVVPEVFYCALKKLLDQSQSGIYIDTGLGSAANTVIPANAGIHGPWQNVLSWTPAYAGVTKD